MKAPVAGSRKAQVYDVFHDKGLEAAIKKAVSLGLKEGTVRSWAGGWAKAPKQAHSPDNRPKRGGAPIARKEKTTEAPTEFSPHFQHKTRGDAARHLMNIARRSGCSEKAYHIIEDNGLFAVVPAHYKPGGPIPQFKDGDIVFDTIIPNQRGKVVKAGPEVCEVRGPDKQTRFIPNYYLYKFEGKGTKEKDEKPVKREKLTKAPAKSAKKTTKKK